MGEPIEDHFKEPTRPPYPGMGALIGIGAGVGVVFGVLLDSIAIGIAFGAGLGTVAGAILESRRRGH